MSYASKNNVFVPDFGARILFLGSKSKRGLNSIKLYRKMKNKRKDGSLHVQNSTGIISNSILGSITFRII